MTPSSRARDVAQRWSPRIDTEARRAACPACRERPSRVEEVGGAGDRPVVVATRRSVEAYQDEVAGVSRDRVRVSLQDLPGRDDGRRESEPGRAVGPDHRDRGAVGLRQDDHAADGQPHARAVQGQDHLGREVGQVASQDRSAPADGLRHPERRPVPPPHRAGEHRHRPRPAALGQAEVPQARRRAARQCRTRPQAGWPVSGSALRWPAAARRSGPCPGGRSTGAVDGRAVLRGRPGGPRRAARVLPRPAARAQQDDHHDHPRHRRGDQAGRSGGDPAGGRQARAGRHPAAAAGRAGRRVRRRIRRQGPRLPLALVPARVGSDAGQRPGRPGGGLHRR